MSRRLPPSTNENFRYNSKKKPRGIFHRPHGRQWIPLALAVLTVAALSLIALQALPQVGSSATQTATPATQQPAVPPPDPPGTIDGAKNPEVIPDEVAYRMIVLAVAEPANATDFAKQRARGKLNPIGLSEDDTTAFLGLLAEYQTKANALDKQVAEVYVRAPIPDTASTDYKQLLALGKQKNQLVMNAVSAIPARLSEEGLEKLRLYLPQAKKGMKIIPDMPMPM
jgi:hypothetical protein